MESRTRAYVVLLVIGGVLVVFLLALLSFFRGPTILSPLPEESGIRIIYISPQPTQQTPTKRL